MCGDRHARVLGRRLNTHQGLRPRHRTAIATTVVRCSQCGLIYTNPRPAPERFAQHYDKPPEEYWEAEFFDERTDYYAAEVAEFRRLWQGRRTPRVLDVGAGIGKTMTALSREGFETYGLEPSHSFHERAVANGIPADRLQLAGVEEAEYDSEAFDFVSFGAVLEHLQDPAAALERAASWLAPGGLIHAEVPSARWLLARTLNAAYLAQGLDYVTNLSPMHPPYHLYEFTAASFHQHGRRVGYRVVSHQVFACSTFLPQPLAALATWIMNRTGTGMQLRVWLKAAA